MEDIEEIVDSNPDEPFEEEEPEVPPFEEELCSEDGTIAVFDFTVSNEELCQKPTVQPNVTEPVEYVPDSQLCMDDVSTLTI